MVNVLKDVGVMLNIVFLSKQIENSNYVFRKFSSMTNFACLCFGMF